MVDSYGCLHNIYPLFPLSPPKPTLSIFLICTPLLHGHMFLRDPNYTEDSNLSNQSLHALVTVTAPVISM